MEPVVRHFGAEEGGLIMQASGGKRIFEHLKRAAFFQIITFLGVSTTLALGPGVNPNGWIQTRGWNFLTPLVNPDGCEGGGVTKMAQNWVAPHVIGLEFPQAGDFWDDIDFGNTAVSQGFEAGDLSPVPRWISSEWLELRLGLPPGSLPNGDVVLVDNGDIFDNSGFLNYINNNIIGLGKQIRLSDYLTIATTYVRNNTGKLLKASVCESSDDSSQVWMNQKMVINREYCGGVVDSCEAKSPVELLPGITKIAILVWEGIGSHGFRLGLETPDGIKYKDGSDFDGDTVEDITFLGAGTGESIEVLTRTIIPEGQCLPGPPVSRTIQIRGEGEVTGDGDATVVEMLTGDLGVDGIPNFEIKNIHPPAAVSTTVIDDSTEPEITDLPEAVFIGSDKCGDLSGSSYEASTGEYTSLVYSGTHDYPWTAEDFMFQYTEITGDFDIAIEILEYSHDSREGRWGHIGLMARQSDFLGNPDNIAGERRSRLTDISTGHTNGNYITQAVQRLTHGGGGEKEIPIGFTGMPRFQRLTRRGTLVQCWISNQTGLGDSSRNPFNDGNWNLVFSNDWGEGIPETLLVGTYFIVHSSSSECNPETARFRLLDRVTGIPPPMQDVKITWENVPQSAVSAGLSYDLDSLCNCKATIDFYGYIDSVNTVTFIAGEQSTWFNKTSGPLNGGEFDNSQDIGDPPFEGSTVYDPGTDTYTLTGSGNDIWDEGDDFHFAYKEVQGDFEAIVRIASRSINPAGDRWGRHGLMARYSCFRDAKFSMTKTLLPTTNPGEIDLPGYQFRQSDGNPGGNIDWWQVEDGLFPSEGRLPSWHRLVRQGDVIYGFLSEDDGAGNPAEWQLIGSDVHVGRPEALLVGVALHSHSSSTAGTIEFDNFQIQPWKAPAPVDCTTDGEFFSMDYSGLVDGTEPPESRTASISSIYGGFVPQIQGERLRLIEEGINQTANAVWYGLPQTEQLTESGFIAEFDVFFTQTANPADGITFAVVQGSPGEVIPECEDDTEEWIPLLEQDGFIGTDAGGGSSHSFDQGTGEYTSTSTSGGDIWQNGDDFAFQYSLVSGDFDIAIEILEYHHATGLGRWGKSGLMARQTDALDPTDPMQITEERTSRHTMVQAHGPSSEDSARFVMRWSHRASASTYEVLYKDAPSRPRFLRLARRGGRIYGYISRDPGLANGALNPYNGCNWKVGYYIDWARGETPPADLLVGFANSEHESDGAVAQTYRYRILPRAAGTALRTKVCGLSGDSLGFQGGTLQQRNEGHPMFSIEFDTWVGGGIPENEPEDGGSNVEVGNYHVGVNLNANVGSVQTNVDIGVATGDLPDIFDPSGIHARVVYAPNGQIQAYLSDNLGGEEKQVLSTRILPLEGEIIFGFTAGTGGATMTAEVDNLVVKTLRCGDLTEANWKPCDSDGDGEFSLTDVVLFLNYIFLGNPLPECIGSLDCDGSGDLTLTDAVQSLEYQFVTFILPTNPAFPNCTVLTNQADGSGDPCEISEGCKEN